MDGKTNLSCAKEHSRIFSTRNQLAVAGLDIAGDGQCFADHGVCFVGGACVVAVQGAGERGFGVVGGHPDGVGDLLDLGLEPDHVRGQRAERDAGRGGGRGRVRFDDALGDRQRYRWLDPAAGGLLRRRGDEANLWTRLAFRLGSICQLARSARSVRERRGWRRALA